MCIDRLIILCFGLKKAVRNRIPANRAVGKFICRPDQFTIVNAIYYFGDVPT